MAKKLVYTELDRPIKEILTEDLVDLVGDLDDSKLIRSIVMNEKKFLSVDYDRSLRGFWYTTVKPTLSRLGKLQSTETETNIDKWNGYLSGIIAELVKEKRITYRDLRIIDTSRTRTVSNDTYSFIDVDTYGYQVSSGSNPEIVLCVEKDTVIPIVSQVASLFGCSWVSGKGQCALSGMEDLLYQIKERSNTEAILLLVLSDYDPSGYIIAETFRNQIEHYRELFGFKTILSERIGITPDQLTEEEIAQNAYTPKQKGLNEWFEETGGINGEPLGLELDALTPNKIRELFLTNLKKFILGQSCFDFIKRSYIQRKVLEIAKPKLEEIIDEVVEEEIDNISLKDFDIWELGQLGYREFPVEDLCTSDRDEAIEEKVNTLLNLN
jgi:hypothetical protein